MPKNASAKVDSAAIRGAGVKVSAARAARREPASTRASPVEFAVASFDAPPAGFARAAAIAPDEAAACTVSIADVAPADGVTLAGLNMQVAPEGNPAQLNVTACLNPFSGVTVSVKFPEPPAFMLSAEPLMPSV